MKNASRIFALLALGLLSACTPEMNEQFNLARFGQFTNQSQDGDATVLKASNLRAGPGRGNKVIAILPQGSQIKIVGEKNGWKQVRCPDSGKTGWISKELVQETKLAKPKQINLRGKTRTSVVVTSKPNGIRVGKLGVGENISIVAEKGDWYQLACGTRISATECWAPKDKFYTSDPILTTSGTGNQRSSSRRTSTSTGGTDFNPFAALFGGMNNNNTQNRNTTNTRTTNTNRADEGLALGSLFSAFSEDDSAPQTFSGQSDAFIRNMNIGTVNLLKALANMEAATGNKELAEQIIAQAASLKRGGETGTATSADYKKAFAVIDQSSISREDLASVPASQGGMQMVNSWIRVGLAVNADIKAFNMAQKMFNKGPNLAELLMNADKLGVMLDLGLNGLPSHIDKAGSWMTMLGNYMQENEIPKPSDEQKKRALVQDGTVTEDEADDLFGDA